MQNTEFYRTLLHLGTDWSVTKVETDQVKREIDVFLEYRRNDAPSPETGESCPIYDHRETRRWRHLDTMQYKTYLHARVPRVRLPNGEVVTIRVPWSEPNSHHSLLFESFAIEMLLASKNQTQTSRLLRISFYQLHRIMTLAVARGLAERQKEREQADAPSITKLSIDEKVYRHGHKFLTIVSDAENGQVLEVTEGRTMDAATKALASAVPERHRSAVTAVAMDMAQTYYKAAQNIYPQAQIVHDKFHLFQYLTNAIDVTRRYEVSTQPILKNSRYIWLKNSDNRSDKDNRRFEQINDINLMTAQAWRVRENFKGMYETCSSIDEAIHYFYKWKDHAVSTTISSVQRVVRIFENNVHGIVNYFRHPITNARAEQLNSKIKQLNMVAKGFRSANHIITAILFFFGNLKMIPQ